MGWVEFNGHRWRLVTASPVLGLISGFTVARRAEDELARRKGLVIKNSSVVKDVAKLLNVSPPGLEDAANGMVIDRLGHKLQKPRDNYGLRDVRFCATLALNSGAHFHMWSGRSLIPVGRVPRT